MRVQFHSYLEKTKKANDIERLATDREDRCIPRTVCIQSTNGERLPIWVSDYVLADYGTGAIMGVPAHDERDIELLGYGHRIRMVVELERKTRQEFVATTGDGVMVNSGPLNGLTKAESIDKRLSFSRKRDQAKRQRTTGSATG